MKRMPKTIWTLVLCAALTSSAYAGNKVAVFHLNGPLVEKPQGDMGFSFGKQPKTLRGMVDRFEQAKDDDEVRAILITVGAPQMGFAQLQELRQAMQDVGKPVYVHVDSLSTGIYALATAAKHISVTPTGDVWVLGFYSESPYLKGLLDHLKVEPDFVHIGDFKSAGETLYRTGPSEPAEANMNWLFDGLYESLVKMISDARYNGDTAKVQKLIDGGPYTAEKALELGMIDSVKFRQDLVADLKAKYGDDLVFATNYGSESGPDVDFGNPFAFFKLFADMMSGKEESTEPAIAIIHVEGAIVTGSEEASPFGGSSGAHSTTIRKALDKAANDDSVKAVVLRVNSPGGSALASEIIYDATQRIRAKGKPVVASMGNLAASGGYYVSCGADSIYADPTTITASIGVVGGKIVTTGMWNWMGVTWHEYQRGASASMMTTGRKWNDDERGRILSWMTEVYGIFKGHIVDHRGKKLKKDIDEMAGGRVYTGRQALDLGLVDEMGSLKDAIEKAADLASIADYEIRVLPKPKTIFDFLRESMDGEETDAISVSAGNLFAMDSPLLKAALPMIRSLDPQRADALMQALTRLQILHTENVVLMTPADWNIRFR